MRTDGGSTVKILITGGSGYIGSTIASACLDAGLVPVILDDLSTGVAEYSSDRLLYRGDIADGALIDRIAAEHPDIHAVVHCAAKTVVPESVAEPLRYYEVNVARTVRLLDHLARNGIHRVIFSSSASVYAADRPDGVDEDAPLDPSSPYARTKAQVEEILRDACAAGPLRAISLRYFNPIGTDPLFRSGPTSPRPTHALGVLISAWQDRKPFTVTGTDWPTRDGSGLRDFVHVWDLARAHVRAVERFDDVVDDEVPYRVLNLGTGRGTTVRELVAIFQDVVGGGVVVDDGARRPGDVAGGFAIVDRAHRLLDWRADLTVADGVRDAVTWAERTRPGSPAS